MTVPSHDLARRTVDLLGPQGPLARALDHYEQRPEQLQMAQAVARALATDAHLLVEAGTGTGKTLAYLVPAILSGRRVVISTGTKALQDQIVHKDLPLIVDRMSLPAKVACMKGLANYVCLRRLRETAGAWGSAAPPHLSSILHWAQASSAGDRAELVQVPDEDPIWSEVTSSSETRIGSRCDDFEDCFVTRMRREAEAAQIVVVNHHLFFADLATRGTGARGIVPDADIVIFDEAQRVEDIATDFFGVRIGSRRVESLIADTRRTLSAQGGASPTATTALLSRLNQLAVVAAEFFSALPAGSEPTALGPEHLGGAALQRSWLALDTTLEAFADQLRPISANAEALALAMRRATEIRDQLASVIDASGGSLVRYVEARGRSTTLVAAPVDLSAVFRERLFFRTPAVVMTSATLSTGGDFSFIRQRLGLDFEVEELVVGSPFDYASQAMLYTPRTLPEPTDPEYLVAAADEIEQLLGITGGGAFVLCTSARAMRTLHAALRDRVDLPCLVQGSEPKLALLDRFRASHDAVLFATASFWEGIDVPGDALRLIVIDRLPFEVPTDPIVAARIQHLTEHGINAFRAYQVPAAALTLKQGFGRLIRSKRDRGIVAILDRRIVTRGYGKLLIASLPPCPRTEHMGAVQSFWGNASSASPEVC